MLSKKAKDDLKARGIDVDALSKAMQATTEVEFTVGELKGYHTDDELTEAITNAKANHEKAYPEILGRDLNKKYNLGLKNEETKDFDKVIAKLGDKAVEKASIPADDKVKDLEGRLKKLQDETIPEYEARVTEWQNKYKEREVYDKYASAVPDRANKFLQKDEHVNRIKKAVAIGENGEAINPATNQPYLDKKQKVVSFSDKVAELYTTNEGWLEPEATAAKPTFHHSTNAGNGGKGAGTFDHDKTIAALSEQYDRSTPDGRAAFQAAYTTAQVNAAGNTA